MHLIRYLRGCLHDTHLALNLMALLLLVLHSHALSAGSPGQTAAYYIQRYGEIKPQQNTQVDHAFSVFNRVRAVADKNSKRLPKLIVVASSADPWAISLPDGHIILSRQAIQACHQLEQRNDACLAFILGHELAHLANDDFWHQEVHAFLATRLGAQRLSQFLKQHTSQLEIELQADDRGLIYAAMAGFQVADLITPQQPKTDFFTYWTQQTHTGRTEQASMQKRANFLRQRMQRLHEKHVFFEFGVRLSHFGHYEDSVYFFREFLGVFPSRAVFNNLGYCHLQLAIQAMVPQRAWFYWLPALLDAQTRGRLTLRNSQAFTSLKQAAAGKPHQQLEQALYYLQQAVDADPAYVPARLNQAIAYLYLGQPHQARIPILEAKSLEPNNQAVAELEALVLYEQSDAELDLWPNAKNRLQTLTQTNQAPLSSLYNLARLQSVRRTGSSGTDNPAILWRQLTERRLQLPAPIRQQVCLQQQTVDAVACLKTAPKPALSPMWRWPLPSHTLHPINNEQEALLKTWKKTDFDWYHNDLYGHIYENPTTQAQVLELDGFVQMQVLKGASLDQPDRLAQYCPRPLQIRLLAQGYLASCRQWAAWVSDDSIREIWQMVQ